MGEPVVPWEIKRRRLGQGKIENNGHVVAADWDTEAESRGRRAGDC